MTTAETSRRSWFSSRFSSWFPSRGRSIRGRLLTAISLLLLLALVGSAVSTGWVLRSYLEHRVDSRLLAVYQRISTDVAAQPRPQLRVSEPQLEVLVGDRIGVIAVSPDGRAALTVGLSTADPQRLIATLAGRPPGRVYHLDQPRPMAVLRIVTTGLDLALRESGQSIAVASMIVTIDIADDRDTVQRLLIAQVAVGAALILLLIGLTVLVLRAGLRPLGDLGAAVEAVGRGERDPHRPLPSASLETAQLAGLLQEAFTARARAEDRLRSFVADASHELRTPLTTISGWVDLYLQGGIRRESETQDALERVEAEVARMRLLIDELALLARLDAQVPLELSALDLAQLAGEVVEDARVISGNRRIELIAPTGVQVLGDDHRLRRVLRNLVGNAVQHTPDGTGVRVEVDETVERAGRMGRVRVSDDGPGIAAEQLPHLFERFWRADESRARGGSGLGLAIVEAVVSAHGGTVTVQSTVGVGTTVTIELPSATNGAGS